MRTKIFLLFLIASSVYSEKKLTQNDLVVSEKRANALSVVNVFETIHRGIQEHVNCTGESPFAHVYEFSPAVAGARLALATFYQSCTALTQVLDVNSPKLEGIIRSDERHAGSKKRQIHNRDKFVNSHIVLSQIKENGEFPNKYCKNTLENLPVYGYGSKPSTSKDGFEIDLFNKGLGVASNSRTAHSIDCSGFIASALASQGLKLRKGNTADKDRDFNNIGTITFESISAQKDTCLERVSFKGDKTIKPGDIINLSRNHIVMIDTLGKNPLGIEGRKSKKECNAIGVDDFNFTYIHSGAIRRSYGPSRVHSSNHISRPGAMFGKLVELARTTCLSNLFSSEPVKTRMYAGKTSSGNKKFFSILRHDSKNSECREEKKTRFVGQECVASCFPGDAAI